MGRVRIVRTADLSSSQQDRIRRLLDEAFEGDFTDDDWQHALGGWHALLDAGGAIAAHASIVPRRLLVGARPFASGYVEALAVDPRLQRGGLGTAVMRAINELVPRHFELGALSSGEWGFYERLGWERWEGPTWVRTGAGTLVRSAEDDDGVMILRAGPSAALDRAAPIVCEERAGDSW